MTKDEAIRILEQICPKRPQKLWSVKRKEAVKMAIEALSCSESPNRSEPKTSDSGSVDSEQPEIKMDRTNDRLIWQQDAIEQIKLLYEGREDDIYDRLWNRALKGATNAIKHHTPTAQPEVIRCENCQKRDDKWEDWEEGKVYWCDIMDGCVKADDYCSYAERRTDE